MFKIQTMNKISPAGIAALEKNGCRVGENLDNPSGLLLRSADLHEASFPESLLAIARAGAGYNNIPVERCTEEGIVVFNAPGANAQAVKEQEICSLVMASRDILGSIEWVHSISGEGENIPALVEKKKASFTGPELLGKTLGVIGLGAVGALVANAGVDLNMRVLGYDPFLSVDAAWRLSRKVIHTENIEELFENCDYISLNVPFTDDTRNMLNAEAFARMKDGVRIINESRAEVVNDEDMTEALKSGKVAKYVTDFADDTVLNADKPGIIVIPHLGASSAEAEDNCATMAVDQVMDYLENGNIRNSVNYPAVSLGAKKAPRVAVIARADAGAAEKVAAAAPGADMACATRGDYMYVLAETAGAINADAISGEGIIRVRVIE